MYVAEVYLADGDNFTFLFIKYCVGFLFVILVPLIALLLEPDIRAGIRSAQQRQNFFTPLLKINWNEVVWKLDRGCVDVDTFENVHTCKTFDSLTLRLTPLFKGTVFKHSKSTTKRPLYRTVFGSAVLCLQNVADDDGDVEAISMAAKGQEEERPLQKQQHRPIAAASSEDGLQMEVEAEEAEGEREEESRQMIGKDGD